MNLMKDTSTIAQTPLELTQELLNSFVGRILQEYQWVKMVYVFGSLADGSYQRGDTIGLIVSMTTTNAYKHFKWLARRSVRLDQLGAPQQPFSQTCLDCLLELTGCQPDTLNLSYGINPRDIELYVVPPSWPSNLSEIAGVVLDPSTDCLAYNTEKDGFSFPSAA